MTMLAPAGQDPGSLRRQDSRRPMPLLQAECLTIAVAGRVLVQGLDLDLEAGELRVIQGPSGVGKSTLLRALAGLIPLQAGSLCLAGETFDRLGGPRWRTRVALVPQGAPPLGGSPQALATELRGFHHQRERPWDDPQDIARRLGLEEGAWSRSWALLSGGERQRAHLALALASQPDILLLDEPTAALDPAATLRVEEALRGRSVIAVSHDETQAQRLGGRILRLVAA